MMEQVRLCAVWPMENWLGYSLNQRQGWTTVQESYSRVLERGPLVKSTGLHFVVRYVLILNIPDKMSLVERQRLTGYWRGQL